MQQTYTHPNIRRYGLHSAVLIGSLSLWGCGGSSSDNPTAGLSVSTITPNSAIVDVVTTFNIAGSHLDQVVGVTLSACDGLSVTSTKPTRLTFSCTPNTAGQQQLQLKNAQGAVVHQGQLLFERQPLVSVVTPDRAKLGRLTHFQVKGASLGEGVTASLSHCDGQISQPSTGNVLAFSCTPTVLGVQQLVVKDASQHVVFQRDIVIEQAAIVHSILPLQTNVKLATVFTVTGEHFVFPMQIDFPVCEKMTFNNQSATQIQFTCTPTNVGVHPLRVLDFSGEVVGEQAITMNPFLTLPTDVFATGITTCATATQNGVLCTADALGQLFGLGQDGELKRGSLVTHTLFTNDIPAPDTTIAADKKCFKDNVTGLIWEQKTNDDGLRDQDWTYTWRNVSGASNGGGTDPTQPEAEGSDGGSTCLGLATPKCNTADYIVALNKNKYCGYSDWRLPVLSELEHLVDFSHAETTASVAPIFQPSIQKAPYWSQTTQATQIGRAWGVDFKTGRSMTLTKTQAYAIRAVR
jgi:phage terminase large subunit-like protein